MPLFGSRSHDDVAQHDEDNGSFFSRNKRNSSSSPSDVDSPNHSRSMMSRFRAGSGDSDTQLSKDPTIKAARGKVTEAERAERDADKALEMARSKVREARQHVKNIEAATREEIRRARAKQQETKKISKGASRLGRHDN